LRVSAPNMGQQQQQRPLEQQFDITLPGSIFSAFKRR